jgi:preprotein translocase subunit YajC
VNHLFDFATILLAATSKTKTSSSSATFLIFIVIIVVALYFLFLRPNQQRAKRARAENSSISVGDKVVSIGGIMGTIEEMDGDHVVLLTGNPGAEFGDAQPTRLVMLRTAIARKVPEPTPEPEASDEPEEPEVEDHADGAGSDDGHASEGDAGA